MAPWVEDEPSATTTPSIPWSGTAQMRQRDRRMLGVLGQASTATRRG